MFVTLFDLYILFLSLDHASGLSLFLSLSLSFLFFLTLYLSSFFLMLFSFF